MDTPREIELKLEIGHLGRGAGGRRLLRAVAAGPGETRDLVSRYFDTSKGALRRRGLVLRVRRDGERWVQTVKGEGQGIERPEWESPVAGEGPDFDALEQSGLLPDIGGLATLRPILETAVRRTTWKVSRNGSEIELALDQGRVTAAGRSEPIAEIELELKGGDAADLFGLAIGIAEAGPVKLGMRSKSERGFGLLDGAEPGPVKPEKLRVAPGLDAGAAFQAVAWACVRHFRLNEAVLLATGDPEALHQARVAMRRLRSAFTLFGPVVAGPEAEWLKRELRALSVGLGEARNLDVYRDRVLARKQESRPDEPGLEDLTARIGRDRDLAYGRIVRRLGAKRLRLAMLRLAAFIHAGDWLRDPGRAPLREQPVGAFAAALLDRRWRRLRKRGRHLARLSPEDRHRVRIEAKKLRYACEFFASLASGRKEKSRRRAFLAALERLQTCLGELNDIATGHALAESLAREGGRSIPPAALFAAGHVSGEADRREAACLRAAADSHTDLRRAKPYWTGWA